MPHASRCVLYARKSTDTEDKQILSIPAQLDELHELAVRMSLPIDEEVTEACSAREPGRPKFSKLLTDVESGQVGVILCWKLDRLARNPVDGGQLIHLLGKGRLREIVTPEGTYSGNGDSKFMLAVLFGAATKMTDDLSQGVRRGNRSVVKRGRIPWNVPLGYLKVRDRPGFRGAGKAVPDPERFTLVQKLWRTMLTGAVTPADLLRKAHGWNLTSRGRRDHPGAPIAASYIYQILRNRFYAGEIVHEGDVYRGEHPAMITSAEFERVQDLLDPRKNVRSSRPSVHEFLYRGLLHCGHCRKRVLTGEVHTKPSGIRFVYYRCGHRKLGLDICRAKAPREESVTTDVLSFLESIVIPKPLMDWSITALDWWIDQEKETAVARIRAAQGRVVEVEKKLRKLTDLAVAGLLEDMEFAVRRAALTTELAGLRETLADPSAESAAWRVAVSELLHLGQVAGMTFREGSPDDRRRLLSVLGPNWVVTDGKAAPLLHSGVSALASVPTLALLMNAKGPNRLPSHDILLNQRKNARTRDARDRAILQWWTLRGSNS